MDINGKFSQLADDQAIENAIKALGANGIKAESVASGEAARKRALEIIPQGAEIMNMTSVTLAVLGLDKEIMDNRQFVSVRNKLVSMDKKTQGLEMQRLGAAPPWTIGSVHAVTEDGHVLIASATGSQLPAYSYGAMNVLWIVGAQKIVKNTDEGMKRLYEYSFPLENERAKKAYGTGSGVNKILIMNKEVAADRIRMIIVKEKLGF